MAARMRGRVLALGVLIAAQIAVLAAPSTARADATPAVSNYPAPYNISYACGITTGPDGALWFSNFRGDSIGRMSTDGTLTTYTGVGISSPCAITTGPDGALWFVNTANASIGRITTGGTVSNYADTSIGSYTQEYPGAITTGPDGALWFTNSRNDSIGRITTGGTVSNFTGTGIVGPRDITVGPDGALWFTNGGSIGRITTAGTVKNYTDPRISGPFGITSGPDGALWFTNAASSPQGSIGRVTTAGTFTFSTDPSIVGPQDITVGPDGALWFTNITSGSIGRITTAGTVSSFTPLGSPTPVGITTGLDGALWFTDYTAIWRMTTAGTFTTFHAPGPQAPFGITAGSDGALWFTNQGNDSIGRIDPTTGAMTNYPGVENTFPGGITAGPDGALWFTNNGNEANGQHDSIGRITTAGVVTSYTDHSIAGPLGITSGPDGALWFTNRDNNSIGRITTAGVVTNYTDPSISSPFGIAAGPDGALWFTNTGNNSIGRITTAGVVSNYTNIFISSPLGITVGPDGALWFTNNGYNADWVGRITTAGTVTHVNAVIGSAITSGPDGALWLTDPSNGLVGRLTMSGIFTSYFDPTISQPYGVVAGPDGAMWFTNTGNNSIGRITVPTTPFTVPDPPTNVSVTPSSQSGLVSIIAPANDGGLRISGYTASCTSSDGGAPGSATVPPITSFAVGGLTNGDTYQCTVTATNAVGTSLPSAASNAFVPLAVPDRPTNVVLTASNASVSVSFTPPVDDGGSPITRYGAACTSSNGGVPGNASGPSSPIVVTGLTNGDWYFCTVTATNVVGTGFPSGLSTGVVPEAVAPDPPTNVSASPGNASASVSFTAPANTGITNYTASCMSSDGGAPGSASGAGTPIAVSGLTNGHTYQCTVTATNAVGPGAASLPSNTVVPAGPPGAPTDVVAIAGNASAVVSWTAPDSNGSPITSYTVFGSGGPGRPATTVPGSQTSATVTGLTNGYAYTFGVFATNGVSQGADSSQSNEADPAGPPDPPMGVVATPGNGSATVSWTRPHDNGNPITVYTITASPAQTKVVVGASQTSATIAGLTNGTSYTFTVHATNTLGDSAESTPSNAVRPRAKPDAPRGARATVSHALISVSWIPPSDNGSPIAHYTVTATPGGKSVTVPGSQTHATIPGLAPGSYTFRVSATNAAGTSPWSAPSPSTVIAQSTIIYTAHYTDSQYAFMIKTAAHFHIAVQDVPKTGVAILAYLLAASHHPATRPAGHVSNSGPHAITTAYSLAANAKTMAPVATYFVLNGNDTLYEGGLLMEYVARLQGVT